MDDDPKPPTPGDPHQRPIPDRYIAWALSAARVSCDHLLTRDELVGVLTGRVVGGPAYGAAVSAILELSAMYDIGEKMLSGLVEDLAATGADRAVVVAFIERVSGRDISDTKA